MRPILASYYNLHPNHCSRIVAEKTLQKLVKYTPIMLFIMEQKFLFWTVLYESLPEDLQLL